jgi:putative membrane protein
MSRRWPLYLLGPVLAVLVWSGIAPYERLTWFLEVFPAIVGLGVMAWTWRRFPLTQLVSTLIAIHIVILCIGGRYTYALVPIGDWVRDWFGLSRNHYDRLGHFAQGFVPAMIAREIFIRHKVVAKAGWIPFLVVCFCLALSAVYELIEWCSALMLGQGADSFLGTQGDVWDTQTDMFLAGVGATCALLTISRWHDRQLARLGAT